MNDTLIGYGIFALTIGTAVGGMWWAYASWKASWPTKTCAGIRYAYETGVEPWPDLERALRVIADTYRTQYGPETAARYLEKTWVRVWPASWGDDPSRPGHGTSGLTFASNFMGFNEHMTAMVVRRTATAGESALFHEICWHVLPGIIHHSAATHDTAGAPFPGCEKWGELERVMVRSFSQGAA